MLFGRSIWGLFVKKAAVLFGVMSTILILTTNLYFVSKTELIGYSNLNIDQGLYYFIVYQDQFTWREIWFRNQMLLMVTNIL